MSNQILVENFYDFNSHYQILESDLVGGERTYKLRGSLGRCNYINLNKRLYPLSLMEGVVSSVQEEIRNNQMLGSLNHPPTAAIDLKDVSHKVTALSINEDGHMIGEITPLSNNYGRELNCLLKDGVRLGVSTRGTGKVAPYNGPLAEGRRDVLEVQPGFKLITVDVVSKPSAGTYPSLVVENVHEELEKTIKFKKIWDMSFKK